MERQPVRNAMDDKMPLLVLAWAMLIVLVTLFVLNASGYQGAQRLLSIDKDYANYWLASRLMLEGKVMNLFLGHDIYFAEMQAVFGPYYPWRSWSYPPSYLLLIFPLGLMPYGLSMLVFFAVTLAFYFHAISLLVQRVSPLAVVLLVPFILGNILYGQNGFMTGALILYGLGLRDRHPILAGLAIGLLTVKPQLGLLFPLLLLYERRWLVLATAAATTIALLMMSALLFGLESWIGFFQHTVPHQSLVMQALSGGFLDLLASAYGQARLVGLPFNEAIIWHGAFAVLVFGLWLWSLPRVKDPLGRAYCFAAAGILVTPYSLAYDLGATSALAALVASHISAHGAPANPKRLVFGLVATLPLLQLLIVWATDVSSSFILLFVGMLIVVFAAGAAHRGQVPVSH
ncbi:glycosyltransferase family 87 protein [Peteryoungia algae]|uniref:DUF2029 domain-containing protein n=1 Tax=Peteryoungia algae TaxID=2919917 RepID=A0ABT0CZN5_9HYPH|nr:glycosyltransferase family 87 protein [Rhizobium sp. SSM4.3]MCJ8238637.1 DUF2029 domain-containing protein [Rhizobium sp. SSM4.3]